MILKRISFVILLLSSLLLLLSGCTESNISNNSNIDSVEDFSIVDISIEDGLYKVGQGIQYSDNGLVYFTGFSNESTFTLTRTSSLGARTYYFQFKKGSLIEITDIVSHFGDNEKIMIEIVDFNLEDNTITIKQVQ